MMSDKKTRPSCSLTYIQGKSLLVWVIAWARVKLRINEGCGSPLHESFVSYENERQRKRNNINTSNKRSDSRTRDFLGLLSVSFFPTS